jgi:hypothetical protein
MRKALTIRKITDDSKEYKATIREDLSCHMCRPNKGCNGWAGSSPAEPSKRS